MTASGRKSGKIVEDEITRIKNDPELCHLIKEEE